jgi:ATP-binding cassette subfamily B protein
MASRLPVAPPVTVLRYFSGAVRKHPWLVFFSLLGPIGLQLSVLATPWYLREFINLLVEPAGTIPESTFVHVIIIIAVLMTSAWAMRRLRGWTQIYLEVGVMAELTAGAYAGLLRHSHHFFASQFSGTLTRRITKYRDGFETLYDVLTMTLLPLTIFIGGATLVLGSRNLTLGVVFALWCVGVLWLQFKLAQWRQPMRELRSAEDSALVGAIADGITNKSAIQLFTGMRHEIERLTQVIGRWRAATLRSWIADENIWTVQGFLMIMLNAGMLYTAYLYWRQGLLTVGDFVLMQTYIAGTFDQIFNINRDLRRVYDALADAGEMVGILEMPPEVEDREHPEPLRQVHGEVKFIDVDFRYRNADTILEHFTLAIRAGEKVALVGPSGAGKSTITKLVLRLYDVTQGSVQIDRVDVREIAQESLRSAIAFVPQDPVLFHRTLRENIRYGRRDATDEEVLAAARKAHCHEFIERLPQQYETFVGERGVKLSGGERQRIAVARAILKDAPILVLDEATSSLDSESEALIQDAFDVLMKGKTVIAIAHRLSTIMHMDRIVVVEGGRIVDEGTHDELLARGGLYQKLWSIQAGGFLAEE